MKRREFVKSSLSVGGLLGLSSLSGQVSLAQADPVNRLVVIFLRGAADVLSLFPPLVNNANNHPLLAHRGRTPAMANSFLFNARVGSASTARALSVAGHGVMYHPEFAALRRTIASDNFAVLTHIGSLNSTRSHFDQEALIESGSVDRKLSSGYLARASELIRLRSARQSRRSIAIGSTLPKSMQGFDAPLLGNQSELNGQYISGGASWTAMSRTDRLDFFKYNLSQENCDQHRWCSSVSGAQTSYDRLQQYFIGKAPLDGASFASQCEAAGNLTKMPFGPPIVTIDYGGWDHHFNQLPTSSSAVLALRAKVLAEGLAKLQATMSANTVVAVMSEFGRTVVANGSMGTDHGRGSAMILMGQPIRRSRIRNVDQSWDLTGFEGTGPNLALRVKTDVRQIMAELISQHLHVGLRNTVEIGSSEAMPVFDGLTSVRLRNLV